MMDRIREEMYETVDLKQCKQVQEFVYLHLKQDLVQPELTWIRGGKNCGHENDGRTTSYGVDRNVQLLLSNVRTDLDSFSEVEAEALMADGYLIAESRIDQDSVGIYDPACPAVHRNTSPCWQFLRVKPYLEDPNLDPLFCRQLEIAGSSAFEVFKRLRWLFYTVNGLGLLLAATLLWHMIVVDPNHTVRFVDGLYRNLNTYRALGVTTLVLLLYGALFLLPRRLRWVAWLRDFPRLLALRAAAATIAAAAAWIHILVFDQLFLWQGRVSRLKRNR